MGFFVWFIGFGIVFQKFLSFREFENMQNELEFGFTLDVSGTALTKISQEYRNMATKESSLTNSRIFLQNKLFAKCSSLPSLSS